MLLGENRLLQWLMGDDPGRTGVPELQWGALPESWGVFVLIGAVVAIGIFVFWMYSREIETCPKPIRIFLGVLRFSVLLLLVILFLKPQVTFKNVRISKRTVAILRDGSSSFGRKDAYRDDDQIRQISLASGVTAQQLKDGQFSRAEIVQKIFEKNNDQLVNQLREKASLKVFDFTSVANLVAMIPATSDNAADTRAESDSTNDGASDVSITDAGQVPETGADKNGTEEVVASESMPSINATGRSTDMWQALREVLSDTSRLSAIVIIGDGQHNGTNNPVDMARKAAEYGIPIFTLAVGDASRPTNLQVTDVYVRATARPDEPFEVASAIDAQDIGAARITVDLYQQMVDESTGKPGTKEKVQSKDISLPPTGGRVNIGFEHRVQTPGKYVFSVGTEIFENESNVNDNLDKSNQLEVVDDKVKVLLIAGAPTWEYRLVQRLLQRDQNISLSCLLQTMDEDRTQEGNEPISRLPRGIDELAKYNVIMMFDPNPDEFDTEWIDNLKLFCKRNAGGLLYMAGPKYTGSFVTLNSLKGIRDILPVDFGDIDLLESTQILANINSRPGRMLIVEHFLDHPVMTFSQDMQENRARWDEMPSIYWSFPAVTGKPVAQVLIERGDQPNFDGNQPLLVASRYGAGTVVYMGFNGTWRWRRVGLQAQFFDKFWIQLVRYLTETRSLSGNRRGYIDATRKEYELADEVSLRAEAQDEQFQPLKATELEAIIVSDDGVTQTLKLKLQPDGSDVYEGSYIAQRTGLFRANLKLPGVTGENLIKPITFEVKPPRVETKAFWLNQKLMDDISSASNGKSYQVDDIDMLVKDIPRLTTKTEINSIPVPLWDFNKFLRIFTFSLPVLLLTIEWALRKKFKLL